jgi:hypothetical protein
MSRFNVFLVVFTSIFQIHAAPHLGANFWDINWVDGAADGFKNGYQNVNPNDPEPWKECFLQEISIYSTIRFMDYGCTNNPFEAKDLWQGKTWASRTQKTARVQRPVAYEYMIDLCNRIRANMWVCIPEFAGEDDEFITELAKLIKKELKPPLKVYTEWSNETWNGIFSSFNYAITRGQALNLPGSNKWEQGSTYHAFAALRIGKIFREVFGADSGRVVVTLNGFAARNGDAAVMMRYLDDPKVNPGKVRPDAFGIAPYAPSMSDDDRNSSVTMVRNHLQVLRAKDPRIKMICYEGGVEVQGDTPGMYEAAKKYLEAIMPLMDDVFCYYMHAGTRWGVKERVCQDENLAHGYRALKDWSIANNPAKPLLSETGLRLVPLTHASLSKDNMMYAYPKTFTLLGRYMPVSQSAPYFGVIVNGTAGKQVAPLFNKYDAQDSRNAMK